MLLKNFLSHLTKFSNRIQSNFSFSTFESFRNEILFFPPKRKTILREKMLAKILFTYFTNPLSKESNSPSNAIKKFSFSSDKILESNPKQLLLSKSPKGKQFAFAMKNFLCRLRKSILESNRKRLLLFHVRVRTLSKRGSPPNSEGKQFGFAKKCAVIHAPRAPRVEGGRMSLACRTSFPVSPGKSIQRPRHGVQHPHRAPKRSTVITILHVTLSAHLTGRGGKGGGGWGGGEGGGGGKRWMEGRRMRRTLTTLQYTGGHGVYKPPQFYLRPF